MIDHISFSQAMTWLRCQRQWYFRYIANLKIPPPGAAVVGSAVHKGLEHLNRVQAATEKVPSWNEVADIYSDTFDMQAPDAIWDKDPGQMKDEGYAGLDVYYRRAAPLIKPKDETAIEREIKIELPEVEPYCKGFVDLISDRAMVIDYKTVRRRVSEVPRDDQLQLWLYSFGCSQDGETIAGQRVWYIMLGKKPELLPKRVPPASRPELMRWLWTLSEIVLAIEDACEKGRFMPAPPGEWLCSPKWCGYWDVCQKEF